MSRKSVPASGAYPPASAAPVPRAYIPVAPASAPAPASRRRAARGGDAGPGLAPFARARLVGDAPAFRAALDIAGRAAHVAAPLLIHGRTGTGKEQLARAIHYSGDRAEQPFVPVNCGALTESLLESELFGHVRGAFTDARADRDGLVAQAEGGTLFLDEVDALSPRGQVALLRFAQSREYRPVGAPAPRRSSARIMAACNGDLPAAAALGDFREDLFWRLAVLVIELPTLAERPGDPSRLAAHFLPAICRRFGLPAKRLSPAAEAAIEAHDWPGNVRELENFLQYAVVMTDGEVIDLAPGRSAALAAGAEAARAAWPQPEIALGPGTARPDPHAGGAAQPSSGACAADPDAPAIPAPTGGFHEAKAAAVARFERDYLRAVLTRAGGNVTRAAELAGTERRTLGRLLKQHGLRGAPDGSA